MFTLWIAGLEQRQIWERGAPRGGEFWEREISIPFFFFPAHHVMVKPLEELLSDGNPAKYREYNWGKFYATRNRSDFKKQEVENIQIHHFKLPE